MAIAQKSKVIKEHQENITAFYNRLIAACKNEKRDDGSGQSLSKLAAQLESSPLEFNGQKINAIEINKILKSLEMIKQGTNNPKNADVKKNKIRANIVNDINTDIGKLEKNTLTCGAGCQGLCTTGCSGCTTSCGSDCTSSCGGSCATACGSNCSGKCSTSCSGCGGGCTSNCGWECFPGCFAKCDSGCIGSCALACASCTSGCGAGCN